MKILSKDDSNKEVRKGFDFKRSSTRFYRFKKKLHHFCNFEIVSLSLI